MDMFIRKYSNLLTAALCLIMLCLCVCGCGPKVNKSAEIEVQHNGVKGIRLGLSIDEVIKLLGNPDERIVTEKGGTLLTYGDMSSPSPQGLRFAFSAKDQKLIALISYSPKTSVMGAKIGMSYSDVKKIVGTPLTEGEGPKSDDGNAWNMGYEYGQVHLDFFSRNANDPVKRIRLFLKF